MEDTKNTNGSYAYRFACLNGFETKEEIREKFFGTDEISSECNTCPNLVYKEGIMSCNLID